MDFLDRIVAAVVILTFLCLPFPEIIHAKQRYSVAQETAPSKITRNSPEYLVTPEEPIPLTEEKSYLKTILAVAGGVLLLGGVALALGGGGGGGGSGGDSSSSGSGSVSVGW